MEILQQSTPSFEEAATNLRQRYGDNAAALFVVNQAEEAWRSADNVVARVPNISRRTASVVGPIIIAAFSFSVSGGNEALHKVQRLLTLDPSLFREFPSYSAEQVVTAIAIPSGLALLAGVAGGLGGVIVSPGVGERIGKMVSLFPASRLRQKATDLIAKVNSS